ncbi:calcium-binding protein [Microvirga thermotolerans]|uniref:Cadherin domain-containing protein n=1 Tax=Microvirga thermotolerans TaxID=2651334 RepID=A0A5P9JU67_9HYPH|nr:calcium-binding protein [Microvirga thermotolerans]QFU15000.1 hypothetical protein GDR74_01525 [Microvirga thermotolerans]
MTNYFFDATHPLPAPGTNALVELADAGTAFVGLDIVTATGIALQATLKQRIAIAEGFMVRGGGYAIELKGSDSAVYNEGSVTSDASHGIVVSSIGPSAVTNVGSITANGGTGIRLSGGAAFVMNRGTLTAGTGIDVVAAAPAASDKIELHNTGTISATGVAVKGGGGGDYVVNGGTIRTTSAEPQAVAIDLGNGNDLYDGTRGAVTGLILLGAGDDTAYGGAQAETFSVGLGSNYVDGGGGNDTVDYSFATAGVTLNLAIASLQYTGFQADRIVNVENAIGSAQDDRLTGNDFANTLEGGAGNDTLDGAFGDDRLDGGAGIDTVRYVGTSPLTVSLAVAGAQNTGVYGSDTLIGIENLEGGAGADRLTGNGDGNVLAGGAGADTLEGGLGNDTLDGGAGEDRAVYAGNSTAYTITPGTESGTFRIVGPEGEDTLKDIRFAQFANKTVALVNGAPTGIFLSAGSIAESTAPNTNVGTLFGSDPDGDSLTYSLVTDAGGLFAVNGSSIVLKGALDYETARKYDLVVKGSDPWGKELVKTVTLSVRNVVETTPLLLQGTASKDSLVGEAGNDRLTGLGGDDALWGQEGNDTLTGGTGNDALIGGAGRDAFVLDARPNVRSNVDTVYDFAPNDDTFHLARKIFSKLPKKGWLAKSAFWIGDHVHDSTDRIVYNKKTGALFYDPDGTGKAAAIQIAVLQKNLKLTYHDFFVT